LTHQLDITLEQRQTREAEFYNRLYARPATWEDVRRCGRFPYTRQFIRTLGDCREKTILDLGCGRGFLSVNLALSLRPHRLIGIDISSEAIARATALAQLCGVQDICEFKVGSAHALPLAGGSVDAVVGVAILHHLEIDVAAPELARVLRPGGQIHLAENNGDNPLLRAAHAVLNRYGWFRRESDDAHPLTRGEIDRFARPFDRVEITVPYVELFRTLSYGQRPLSRFEPGLRLLDRALCNPLTRGVSMARWICAAKDK
jgi:ubiquinone/menaquinone biosynthesis C-methylase UbiE